MIHANYNPETTTEREAEQLAKLDKYQKRYLSHRRCGLCEHPLDHKGCGSHYEACPEGVRIERRRNCLRGYKPRKARRAT